MGYERSDRRYGRDQDHGDRTQGRYGNNDRGYDRGPDHDRSPPRDYDDDRGIFDRAGDEVRSWFGDEEAERRRRMDERLAARDYERNYAGRGSAPSGGGYGRSDYGVNPSAGRDREQSGRDSAHRGDPHYSSWRERQIASLDRDYDEYRRENQTRFESEFGDWRNKRQGQRQSLGQVREHQEVVGSDGEHVGKVDHLRGDRILLTKTDKDAGGHHHSIPCSWISNVDEKVTIDRTAAQAQQAWKDEERNSAFREGADRSEGPHILNRSFSGTY